MGQSSSLMSQFVVHVVEAPIMVVMGGADVGNNWTRIAGLLVVRYIPLTNLFSALQ